MAFEVVDDALRSPLFALVLGLMLVVLAYVRVVGMVIAVALGAAWLISVFGISRYKKVLGLIPSARIGIILGSAVCLGLVFSLLGMAAFGHLEEQGRSTKPLYPANESDEPLRQNMEKQADAKLQTLLKLEPGLLPKGLIGDSAMQDRHVAIISNIAKSGAMKVYVGPNLGYTTNLSQVVIRIGGEDVLTIHKTKGGIVLDAAVRSEDRRIVIKIERNVPHPYNNNVGEIQRPDAHSLLYSRA